MDNASKQGDYITFYDVPCRNGVSSVALSSPDTTDNQKALELALSIGMGVHPLQFGDAKAEVLRESHIK